MNKLDTIISNKQRILQQYKKHLNGIAGLKIMEPDGLSNHIPLLSYLPNPLCKIKTGIIFFRLLALEKIDNPTSFKNKPPESIG